MWNDKNVSLQNCELLKVKIPHCEWTKLYLVKTVKYTIMTKQNSENQQLWTIVNNSCQSFAILKCFLVKSFKCCSTMQFKCICPTHYLCKEKNPGIVVYYFLYIRRVFFFLSKTTNFNLRLKFNRRINRKLKYSFYYQLNKAIVD